MVPKPVGKVTMILGKPLSITLNKYIQDHPKEDLNLRSRTSVVKELLKKALEAEGYQVEEEEK